MNPVILGSPACQQVLMAEPTDGSLTLNLPEMWELSGYNRRSTAVGTALQSDSTPAGAGSRS